MQKSWGASLFSLEHSYAQIIISYIHLACWIFWIDLFFFFFCAISSFFNLWILNIVCFPTNYVYLVVCILFHSYLEKYTLVGRKTCYISLLNFSAHFGNRCQWGRSLEGLVWGGSCFGFILKHLSSSSCIFVFHDFLN